jgi:rRNA processing protein Gar1
VVSRLNTGKVSSVVGDQVVVESASEPPRIGAKAYLGRDKVGVVADVIGRVDRPYFIVKPDAKSKLKAGDEIYTN